MRKIEVDEEVYGELQRNVSGFGETPNSVLRRLLKLQDSKAETPSRDKLPLQELFASPQFRYAKGVVGRFLAVLSWLYRDRKEQFFVVENIRGRGRLYFSKNVDELRNSGTNVNPKQIPNCPYWVITTTPTSLKQEILENVMKALNCDADSVRLAREAIAE